MENHSLTIYPDEVTGGHYIVKKNGEKAIFPSISAASDALMAEYPVSNLDLLIDDLNDLAQFSAAASEGQAEAPDTIEGKAARRLEECRAFLTRFTDGSGAPEGHTFESWARELLA